MDIGGNGREREVGFPKIILRPHFKKENLRLLGGGVGVGRRYVSQRKVRKGEDELGMEVARGRTYFPVGSVGRGSWRAPSQVDGGGPPCPCVGLARTEPKTT